VNLGAKRELFSRLLPLLLAEAHGRGFEVMIDEVKRGSVQAEWNSKHCGTCKETKRAHVLADHEFHAIGIADSVHVLGLAVDLILRRYGRPLWARKHFVPLGAYWESLDPDLCAWGGRFRDPGHFSLKHGGRR